MIIFFFLFRANTESRDGEKEWEIEKEAKTNAHVLLQQLF